MYGGGDGGGGYGDGGGASEFAGGGFMPAPSTPASGMGGGAGSAFSPSAGGKRAGGNSSVLFPFTVRQLASSFSGGDVLMVHGQEVSNVVVVGKIAMLEHRSTDLTLVLDDGTGKVEVRKWHDDQEQERDSLAAMRVGMYVKVHGLTRKIGTKHLLSANSIRPIQDFNEVTCHFLDCIFVYLHGQKTHAQDGSAPTGPSHGTTAMGHADAAGGGYGGGPTNAAPSSAYQQKQPGGLGNVGGANDSRLPLHERVLKYFAQHEQSDPAGVHRDLVARSIPGASPQQVLDTIQWLVNEGHLYSTIDDMHYRTLGDNA